MLIFQVVDGFPSSSASLLFVHSLEEGSSQFRSIDDMVDPMSYLLRYLINCSFLTPRLSIVS